MRRRRALLLLALCGFTGCTAPTPAPRADLPPVRFLLTFDDGPSGFTGYNPTRAVLDTLAANPTEPGIKAVFFVQTRARGGAATALGQALLRSTVAAGHVLGLHSGSVHGHLDHVRLPPQELERTLVDGVADLVALTGHHPRLVRPPFWRWDERTLAAYRAHGLAMLLTDLNARDGKIYGWTISLRRRSHLRSGLAQVREYGVGGQLPVLDGVLPIIVALHDTNTYTASHLSEYLQILLEEAAKVGLQPADPPFYNDAGEIERIALARAQAGRYACP